ncbi:MAG: peptidylprolyl isomerase [Bacteroidia bacterium]
MKYQKHLRSFSIIVTVIFLTGFHLKTGAATPVKIAIVTDLGTIKIQLYDQTPLHRDNFIKLVKEYYFDSLLFHRVIEHFMIQSGDPDSKHAKPELLLGDGGPNYTIPAELNKQLFHKKGVLAAARNSDLENPTRASSASQFYIVQGKVFSDSLLKIQAARITKSIVFKNIINKPENKQLLVDFQRFNKSQLMDSIKYINDIINQQVEKELPAAIPYQFSAEQVKAYTTIGGTPHLDNNYTVFGEVYEGLEIVDLIAAQPVDKNDRPIKDIRILSISIIQ